MRSSGSRSLRLAVLLTTFALLGCGSGRKSGTGSGLFRFSIYDMGTGEALPCAQIGAATVRVTLFDASGNAVAYNDASCAGGEIATPEVATGSYIVGLDLFSDPTVYGSDASGAGGVAVYLDSFDLADASGARLLMPIRAGLNDFRDTTAEFYVRSFVVSWTFTSGAPAAVCAALGAAYVDLDFTVVGAVAPVTSRFACTDGQGISLPYPMPETTLGQQTTTTWQLHLVDSAYNSLGYIDGGSVGLDLYDNTYLGTQLFPY